MFCFFEKNEKKGQENIISKSLLKFPLAGCEKKKVAAHAKRKFYKGWSNNSWSMSTIYPLEFSALPFREPLWKEGLLLHLTLLDVASVGAT